jgi:hypothetical protein
LPKVPSSILTRAFWILSRNNFSRPRRRNVNDWRYSLDARSYLVREVGRVDHPVLLHRLLRLLDDLFSLRVEESLELLELGLGHVSFFRAALNGAHAGPPRESDRFRTRSHGEPVEGGQTPSIDAHLRPWERIAASRRLVREYARRWRR